MNPRLRAKFNGLCHAHVRSRPSFTATRSRASVQMFNRGEACGAIIIAHASVGADGAGLSFQSFAASGCKILPMIFAKEGQFEWKSAAYVCAFIAHVLDDRPSEEKRHSSSKLDKLERLVLKDVLVRSDPKDWYSAMATLREEEAVNITVKTLELWSDNLERRMQSVFFEVSSAIKSARGEDVTEAVERVKRDLPFLSARLSEEEWVRLYREASVDDVHAK